MRGRWWEGRCLGGGLCCRLVSGWMEGAVGGGGVGWLGGGGGRLGGLGGVVLTSPRARHHESENYPIAHALKVVLSGSVHIFCGHEAAAGWLTASPSSFPRYRTLTAPASRMQLQQQPIWLHACGQAKHINLNCALGEDDSYNVAWPSPV